MRALANKAGLDRATSRGILENVAALYGVQVGRKLIPLVSIPYLARTLGPASWGQVAFVCALAEFLVILIEFGFNISATREVARHRDNPEECGRVMTGVLGAQCLLATGGVLLALAVSFFVPSLREQPRLLAASLLYGVAQGFAPLWFFQGLERMRLSAALEMSGKLAMLGGLFLFVHSPADGWIVPALYGIAPGLTTAAGLVLARRDVPFARPSVALVKRALSAGWPMFVFRSAESLYGVGNAFILGLFTTPEMVGYFVSAEKISKAAFGLLNPIREAIFPRLSHLAARGGEGAAAPLARLSAAVMVAGGLALGIGLFLSAPLACRVFLGESFAPAIAVLRILSALPPLLAVTYSTGFQWLLPLGRDALVNRIVLSAGLINVALSFVLARPYGHIGMAWAVVAAETFVAANMLAAMLRTAGGLRTPGGVAAEECG